ncbi:MAG: NUDIX hydrolase [Chloroflexi bacterium]|nr:NUDIX hydrolase [Chloroflexota bacterium]
MRKIIGHAPLVLAGAAVFIFNERGELLMLLRSDINCWGIPGGGMNLGESLEQTAVRETLEETGLHVDDLELFDVFSGPDLMFQYPNGDITYNVSAVYIAHTARGGIVLNEEHTDWQYFPLDRLPENIAPPIKPVLKKFKIP